MAQKHKISEEKISSNQNLQQNFHYKLSMLINCYIYFGQRIIPDPNHQTANNAFWIETMCSHLCSILLGVSKWMDWEFLLYIRMLLKFHNPLESFLSLFPVIFAIWSMVCWISKKKERETNGFEKYNGIERYALMVTRKVCFTRI